MKMLPCPLCGCVKNRFLFSKRDWQYHTCETDFNVVRCQDCGFVFINPRPENNQELAQYYPQSFYDSFGVSPNSILDSTRHNREIKLSLCRNLPSGRLLDIGCAYGDYILSMRDELGWNVEGVEFGSLSKIFDVPIFAGQAENTGRPSGQYDLVTLWAVLEHVLEPLVLGRELHRLLAPGGHVIMALPNFNSIFGRWMRRDDIPRHCNMFTPKTVRYLLTKCGFRDVNITFNSNLYYSYHRGFINMIFKWLAGEPYGDVVRQHRTPGNTPRFISELHGKPSRWMPQINRVDKVICSVLDKVVDRIGIGSIMIVRARKLA